jgi:hypothetical protein
MGVLKIITNSFVGQNSTSSLYNSIRDNAFLFAKKRFRTERIGMLFV